MVLTAEKFWSRKGQISEEEPATTAEATALRDFIEQRSESAKAARELLSTREDETALDGKLNRVAYLVSDAVVQFPDAHERMADLLLAIQQMKPEEMGWTEDQKKRFPDWNRWIEYDQTGTCLVEFRESTHFYFLLIHLMMLTYQHTAPNPWSRMKTKERLWTTPSPGIRTSTHSLPICSLSQRISTILNTVLFAFAKR